MHSEESRDVQSAKEKAQQNRKEKKNAEKQAREKMSELLNEFVQHFPAEQRPTTQKLPAQQLIPKLPAQHHPPAQSNLKFLLVASWIILTRIGERERCDRERK